MTLASSTEVVAILYDIENAPFEMLNYTLGKARRYQPCRTIVVSDWEARPEQKRWEKLLRRPGFTFRQISRTYHGKNSLDSALYDSAKILYDEGVRRFFIITTDSDFVRMAQYLKSGTPSYIIGVGTKQASEVLRNAYDEFLVYPPEEKKVKKETASKPPKASKTTKAAKNDNNGKQDNVAQAIKYEQPVKAAKTVKVTKSTKSTRAVKAAKEVVKPAAVKEILPDGTLSVRLPKTLRQALDERRQVEDVSLDELVTYLLMRGLSK